MPSLDKFMGLKKPKTAATDPNNQPKKNKTRTPRKPPNSDDSEKDESDYDPLSQEFKQQDIKDRRDEKKVARKLTKTDKD